MKYFFTFLFSFFFVSCASAESNLIFSDSFETYSNNTGGWTTAGAAGFEKSSDYHTLGNYSIKAQTNSAPWIKRTLSMPDDFFISYSMKQSTPYWPIPKGVIGWLSSEGFCGVVIGFNDGLSHDIDVRYLSGVLDYRIDQGEWTNYSIGTVCTAALNENANELSINYGNWPIDVYYDNLRVYSGIPAAYNPADVYFNYYDLSDTVPDFQTSPLTTCIIGHDCEITFTFNDQAVGGNLYLMEDKYINGGSFYNDSFATGTLQSAYPHEINLYMSSTLTDDYTASSTASFSAFYTLGDYSKMKSAYRLIFVEESFYDMDFLNVDPCADVATSSGTYWDDFRYGIECGARRAGYWLIKPTPDSLLYFKKSVNNFESSFPFNLVFDIANHVQYKIASSTAETYGDEFGLPMVDEETGGYTMINGIDSDSFNDAIGSSTASMLETYADMFLWIMAAAIVVLTIVYSSIIK